MRTPLVYTCLFAFVLIVGCKNKKNSTTPESLLFQELVQSYTNNTISIGDEVFVRFNAEIEGAQQGKSAPVGTFSLSPSVKGNAYWFDARTLAFKPDNHLKPGCEYTAVVDFGKLFADNKKGKGSFGFRTKAQDISVRVNALESKGAYYRLSGVVYTADLAADASVEKVVSVGNKSINSRLQWIHDTPNNSHRFMLDSLARVDDDIILTLSWDGSPLGVDKKESQEIVIPGLKNFNLLGSQVVQQPSQMLVVEFSDPINANQDLTGLVQVEDEDKIKVTSDGNLLRVYFSNRIYGKRKVIINGGLQNIAGYSLNSDKEFVATFDALKPSVAFVQSGVIIPTTGNSCVVPFKAVNLSSVDVYIIRIFEKSIPWFLQDNDLDGDDNLTNFGRLVAKKRLDLITDKTIDHGVWNVFAVDLKEMLTVEPGAIYRVEIRFKKEYSLYPCENSLQEPADKLTDDAEEKNEDEIWDRGYYWPRWEWSDDYEWSRRDDPCHSSYYMNRWVYRNVLATNLGMLVKSNGNNSYRTIVTNLTTATVVSSAKVSFFNHQNQLLGQTTTNGEGVADITISGKPWLAMAEADGQKIWLRVNDGMALSYSSFDVSGMSTQKGLQGFIYGDRGVWRPGDTLHLCFIVHDESGELPEGQPATLYFYNPEGKLVNKMVNTSPTGKFYRFDLNTAENDPTGNWTVKVKIGGALFSKTVKIETIKPNRLKINLDFGGELLNGSKTITGKLAVNWLHGAIGKNLKARADLNFVSQKTRFRGYDSFIFDDPAKEFESKEETIFDGVTAADGTTSFSFQKDLSKNAPGMLKAIFTVKAFEPGGEFSIIQRAVDFSPFGRYVGLRMPEKPKKQWYYTSGKEYALELVSLDKNGKPVDAGPLEVIMYKVDWSWWWNSGSESMAYYISSKKYQPVFTKKVTTTGGKASVNLGVAEKEWGRYLIRVVDKDGHSSGFITYFDWPWRKSNEGAGGATRLTFSTDKEKYTVGENIKVIFPGEAGSRAFVTVECDNRILLSRWVEVTNGGGNFELEATGTMAPNAYINIVLLQPHTRTVNENPIRMYGAIPVFVENPQNKLEPVITMDEKLEPEKQFSVQISEQTGKAMTYTVAVVDEGLLDITNFKTPDPHESFFRRRGLSVKTWDVYDLVSGAYGGKLEKVFGIGGDEDLVNKEKKEDGRFKPVVIYAGPFELKAGKTQKHTFTMPKYIGSVRTMVVAGHNNAYGNAEVATPVKTPVMVLATLPRLLAPGEKVALPVSVFAMDAKVKSVEVAVKTNDMLRVATTTKTIEINGEGEYNCSFDVVVSEREGTGKVEVVVKSSLGSATYDISIPIRNPNSPVKKSIAHVLQPGQQKTITLSLPGIKGTNKANMELSSIQPVNLNNRLNELIQYPYGCVEQTVSAVFSQLYVGRIMDISPDKQKQIESNVVAAINRLQSFQRADGGFSYWPGSSYADDWGTSYAGHFLTEAERAGYLLPFGMKDRWLNYQKSAASNWKSVYKGSSGALSQAYRLYTMALASKPDLSAMNRLRLSDNLSQQTKWRLALSYALAGKPEMAGELIDVRNLDVVPFEELEGSYGSAERDMAMLLETFVQLGNKEQAARLQKVLAQALSSEKWYSTQTTSWMILSVCKAHALVSAGNTGMKAEYVFTMSGSKTKINTAKTLQGVQWNPDRDTVVSVTNTSDGVLFVNVNYSGVPSRDNTPAQSKKLDMSVRFVDLQGNEVNPESIPQGTDFKMVAVIKQTGENFGVKLSNVAFTQVFPSGWEIINSRLYGAGYQTKSDTPGYMDIRDDRVNLFFDLESGETKRFEVLLNAAYVGDYVLPAATAFTMYSNNYFAKTAGTTVKVTR